MKNYKLLKSNRYVIYGAAFMGKLVLQNLQEAGYAVEAFLDQRADKLKEVNGIRVYHPDQYEEINKDNLVIIIAITNVFEHPKVATYLFQKGYARIICKLSADNTYGAGAVQNWFQAYDSILEGKANENMEIEEFTEEYQYIYFEDGAIIKQPNHDEVVAYIPLELCFTGKIFMPEEFRGRNKEYEETECTPVIYSQTRIIELFRAIEGGEGKIKAIIEDFKEYFFENPGRYYSFERTQQGFNDFISNRVEVYTRMSQLLNKGMDFFINIPAEVVWNENGFFELKDGTHRVCFFASKGLKRIPAKMSVTDYQKWKNEKNLSDCIRYMKKADCLPAYAPIPHPNFYNYPVRRDSVGITRIERICSYLYKNSINVKEMKVIDVGSYFSYFSQFFSKMGAKVTTIESYESSYEAGKMLNQLLYCDNIKAMKGDIADISIEGKYDITIMLTVFYPLVNTEKGEKVIRKIAGLTEKILLWESGGEPEQEKNYILSNTDFIRYEKISETYGTGFIRELGVYYK